MPFAISYAVLWGFVVFQTLVLLGLTRSVYRLREDLTDRHLSSNESLRGQEAPTFNGIDVVSGTEIDSRAFHGRMTALLFVAPDCASCGVALDDMSVLTSKTDGRVLVVCRGSGTDCARLAADHGLTVPVLADDDFEISRSLAITAVPTAVLIDDNNRIASYGRAMQTEELAELMESDTEYAVR